MLEDMYVNWKSIVITDEKKFDLSGLDRIVQTATGMIFVNTPIKLRGNPIVVKALWFGVPFLQGYQWFRARSVYDECRILHSHTRRRVFTSCK